MSLPHKDLVDWINHFGAALTDGTTKQFVKGVNLFSSPLRAALLDGKRTIPVMSVFINAAAGSLVTNASGQAASLRRYLLSAVVRSESGSDNDLENAELIADELFKQIHRNPPSGYAQCIVTESQYRWDGQDDRGAHELSFSVLLHRKGRA